MIRREMESEPVESVAAACGVMMRENDPDGIRTRVTGVKGQCPRPLDDRAAREKSIP